MKTKRRTKAKKHYHKPHETIGRAKRHIMVGLWVFLLCLIIGFFFPYFFQDQILEVLKQILNSFEGKNLFETVIHIFLNNAKASFFAIILGIAFGIIPIFIAAINGYLIGFVMRMVVDLGQGSTLWQLLPHGVFELPAIIISIGLGVYLGEVFFQGQKKTKKGSKHKGLKQEIKNILITYLLIILPLLAIAAIIETILIFTLA